MGLRIDIDTKTGQASVKALKDEMLDLGDAAATTEKEIDGFEKSQSSANKTTGLLGGAMKALPWVAVGAAAVGAGKLMVGAITGAVSAASDLEESTSKFGVVFADQAEGAAMSLDELTTSYGLSTRAASDFLSEVQDLLVPMGVSSDTALKMSDQIVKLSTDLGSFNNLPTDQVLNDITAALTGSTETTKKYGVAINAAMVEEKALAMGLANSKKEITFAHKAMATYQLILEGTKTAQGDFIRTSDGLANASKTLSSNFEDLKAKLGAALIPAISAGVTALGELIGVMADPNSTIGGFINLLVKGVGGAITVAVQGFRDALHGIEAFGAKVKEVGQLLGLIGDESTEASEAVKAGVVGMGDEIDTLTNRLMREHEYVTKTTEQFEKMGVAADVIKDRTEKWSKSINDHTAELLAMEKGMLDSALAMSHTASKLNEEETALTGVGDAAKTTTPEVYNLAGANNNLADSADKVVKLTKDEAQALGQISQNMTAYGAELDANIKREQHAATARLNSMESYQKAVSVLPQVRAESEALHEVNKRLNQDGLGNRIVSDAEALKTAVKRAGLESDGAFTRAKAKAEEFRKQLKDKSEPAVLDIGGAATKAGNQILSDLGDAVVAGLDGDWSSLGGIWDSALGTLRDIGKSLTKDLIGILGKGLMSALSGEWKGMGGIFDGIFGALKGKLGGLGGLLKGGIGKALGSLGGIGKAVSGKLLGSLGGIGKAVGGKILGGLGGIGKTVGSIGAKIGSMFGGGIATSATTSMGAMSGPASLAAAQAGTAAGSAMMGTMGAAMAAAAPVAIAGAAVFIGAKVVKAFTAGPSRREKVKKEMKKLADQLQIAIEEGDTERAAAINKAMVELGDSIQAGIPDVTKRSQMLMEKLGQSTGQTFGEALREGADPSEFVDPHDWAKWLSINYGKSISTIDWANIQAVLGDEIEQVVEGAKPPDDMLDFTTTLVGEYKDQGLDLNSLKDLFVNSNLPEEIKSQLIGTIGADEETKDTIKEGVGFSEDAKGAVKALENGVGFSEDAKGAVQAMEKGVGFSDEANDAVQALAKGVGFSDEANDAVQSLSDGVVLADDASEVISTGIGFSEEATDAVEAGVDLSKDAVQHELELSKGAEDHELELTRAAENHELDLSRNAETHELELSNGAESHELELSSEAESHELELSDNATGHELQLASDVKKHKLELAESAKNEEMDLSSAATGEEMDLTDAAQNELMGADASTFNQFKMGPDGELKNIWIQGLPIDASNFEKYAKRESGGGLAADTFTIGGERRPELFVPRNDGYVFPSIPSTFRADGGGGGDTFQFDVHINGAMMGGNARAFGNQVAMEGFSKFKRLQRLRGRK